MVEYKRPEMDWEALRAERIAEMIGLGFSDEQAAAEARLVEARVRARVDYSRGLIDRLKAANEAVERAWMRFFDEHPEYCEGGEKEDEDCGFEPEEQAEADAAWAAIDEVIRHDRWPAHLHFGGV